MNRYEMQNKFSNILDSIEGFRSNSESLSKQREGIAKEALGKLLVASVLNDLEEVIKDGSLETFTEYRLRNKIAKEMELTFK